jgi:hypothetical protein
MTFSSRALRVSCVALVTLGLAACSGSDKKPAPAAATPTMSASPTVTPLPVAPAAKVNPLTGGRPNSYGVVAVKIDDVAAARPQVGVASANVVYVEQVEGGLTRLIAVFNTVKPKSVGPVRSVRANDPELLSQYGPIAFVASGGGGDSLPELDKSILKADINDRGGPGFYRDDSRPVPHNLLVNLALVPKAAPPRSIGWTWAASTAGLRGSAPVTSISTVVGATAVGFTWSAKLGRWIRVIDGVGQRAADGSYVSTPNVIVQFTKGHVNPGDIDPMGNPGYFTESVGSGRVVVYRNGHRVVGTWSRPKLSAGTTLTDKSGKSIALAPGGAWVVLVANGAPLH